MKIKFWGVRGSIASPGHETAGVGGNTSCVEVLCGETRIILDAGTGLRGLGAALTRVGADEVNLLLSHHHWDHIQGLPFFVPAYVPTTRVKIFGATPAVGSLRDVLEGQMRAPVFPVRFDELPSWVSTRELRTGESFEIGEAVVRCAKLNHPGGVLAYRIEHGGHSVVYATDTEHYSCVDPSLHGLADGADVLIYDSQYTPEEYAGDAGPSKVGWGHSTFVAGARAAQAAGVGEYVLYHHDPSRTDAGVAELEERARRLFARSSAAREGREIDVATVRVAA